ncbi:hypothetical protein KC19_5G034100 [Ceratodon purpureus]|uniref:Xaa-Pro dipeptidyl-peptidase-like domain-containing protein n=2 Tax=Ceratodon purpureus TaxID=3225 RepID=A0A8T0HXI3_CERPU|nr:hypothetical protein KC19_5G034100 [Ceratodon purpureus]
MCVGNVDHLSTCTSHGHKDVRASVRREPSIIVVRPRGYLDASGLMMETTRVESSPGVTLAVRVFRPKSSAAEKAVTMVLVHQYSLMGGCQELLRGMAYRLAAKGFTTVTFDMRGVGTSSGKATLTGASEIQDVVAVCQWAAKHCTASSILLVGSSAGAPIAGAAIDSVKEVVGYVSLGYPFGLLASVLFGRHNKACLQSPKPKMFVMGTNDGFTTVKQLESKLKSAAGRVEKRLVRGAGHFEMEGAQYDDQMVEYLTTFADSLQLISS